MKTLKKCFSLLRVKHYVKNLLIFAALACSGQLFKPEKFLSGLFGFLTFSLIASAIYVLNDIRDKEKDRLHPTKCKRPIASGAIGIKSAVAIMIFALILGLGMNFLVWNATATVLLVLYFALNFGYSLGLKDYPIVDISILVSGFLLRVMYGAIVTGITISNWLYLAVMAISFYLALGKRRNELKFSHGETRKVLKAYPIGFLDKCMYMCLTLFNAFYALWCLDKSEMSNNSQYLFLTIPVVLLISLKYSMTVEGDSDGDPVEVLLHDKILIALCAIYATAILIIIYL